MLPEEKRIRTKAQLKEWLAVECGRYPLSARRILPYLLQISEGAILRRHIILLRTTEYHTNAGHRLRAAWYYLRLMRLQNRYALHIPINTCGKGLMLSHVFPVCMNGKSTVGEYCRVMPLVSLNGDDSEDRAPTVGDHVTLGYNATLIGGITLGDHVTVGSGAVVTHSFPEAGVTLVGNPARVLNKGGAADAAGK